MPEAFVTLAVKVSPTCFTPEGVIVTDPPVGAFGTAMIGGGVTAMIGGGVTAMIGGGVTEEGDILVYPDATTVPVAFNPE